MARNAERRADPRTLWPEAKSIIVLGRQLRTGPRSAGGAVAARYRRDLGLCAGLRLSRRSEGQAQAARLAHRRNVCRRRQGLHRHRAGAREAAGAGGRRRLAGQAHQSGQPGIRIVAVSRIGVHDARDRSRMRPDSDHCGQCHACLDICPTHAFPAPYQLDARRCISYLTIEHKGHIPREFREAIGNRIYGCDDCLAVCPWNKFARAAHESGFHARAELRQPQLADLARLDDAGFRALFRGSPVKRIGRDRFVRNVLIAIGNSGNAGALGRRRRAAGRCRRRWCARWRCGRCRGCSTEPGSGSLHNRA